MILGVGLMLRINFSVHRAALCSIQCILCAAIARLALGMLEVILISVLVPTVERSAILFSPSFFWS